MRVATALTNNQENRSMLTDPLNIGVVTHGVDGSDVFNGVTNTLFELQDLATDGSTRVGTLPLEGGIVSDGKLAIRRSQSNENKPVVSDRTLIRFDAVRPHPTSGKAITMSAYLVTALPQGGDPFTKADQVCLIRTLALFLLKGETNGTETTAIDTAAPLMDDVQDTLARVMRGVA